MYTSRMKEINLYQILANECRVYGSVGEVAGELKALDVLEREGRTDEARQVLKCAVEKRSQGENTVIYDDAGIPSVMVRVSAMTCAELVPGSASGMHPAFLYAGKTIREVWVAKYLTTVVDGHAASLPMAEPTNLPHFDAACAVAAGKGRGWQMMPFQLRAAILLDCLRRGVYPTGNTERGHDYYSKDELGVMLADGRVLTGSGPLTWTHNRKPSGIWDLSGNLNEWDCGFRLMNGEIQFMNMEDLLAPACDLGPDSPMWKAVDLHGQPAAPGSEGTLHLDGCDGTVRLTNKVEMTGLGNCAYCNVSTAEGLEVPAWVKLWGLYPAVPGLPETAGWRWINTEGEALPLSGGAYRIVDHSGMFFMGVTKPRGIEYQLSGMRLIYVAPDAWEEADK